MTITHKLIIDLVRPAILPPVAVVQGDTYSREVQISLYAAGVAWELPEGHDVAIRYSKPDGTAGKYDTMPDGSMAWRSEGNTVNIMLCPQMLTVPGEVPAQVSIILAERTISTFTFFVSVAPDASKGALTSENYINWRTAFLPQLTGAKVGQYPVIAEVDEKGRVVVFEAVAAPSGGGGGSGVHVGPDEPTDENTTVWIDPDDDDTVDFYTKPEIDAIMGSYINDIDTLIGGDS